MFRSQREGIFTVMEEMYENERRQRDRFYRFFESVMVGVAIGNKMGLLEMWDTVREIGCRIEELGHESAARLKNLESRIEAMETAREESRRVSTGLEARLEAVEQAQERHAAYAAEMRQQRDMFEEDIEDLAQRVNEMEDAFDEDSRLCPDRIDDLEGRIEELEER